MIIKSIKGQCHEIFCFRFFHKSFSPKSLIITKGSFRIFSKIRGDFRKSRCTTGINDTSHLPGGFHWQPVSLIPVANLPNDDGSGGKFAIGVNSRMPHNSMNAEKRRNTSYCRDANIRRDTNIGGNKRCRRAAGPQQQQKSQQQYDATTEDTPAT